MLKPNVVVGRLPVKKAGIVVVVDLATFFVAIVLMVVISIIGILNTIDHWITHYTTNDENKRRRMPQVIVDIRKGK